MDCKTYATKFNKTMFFLDDLRSPEKSPSDGQSDDIAMLIDKNGEFVDSQEIRNSTF